MQHTEQLFESYVEELCLCTEIKVQTNINTQTSPPFLVSKSYGGRENFEAGHGREWFHLVSRPTGGDFSGASSGSKGLGCKACLVRDDSTVDF